MTDQGEEEMPVRLAAREIPPPSTISPAARKALADGAAQPPVSRPALEDVATWRKQAADVDSMWQRLAEPILEKARVMVETSQIAGVPCHDAIPAQGEPTNAPVYLFVHGGAFYVGGGAFAKVMAVRAAEALGVRTISVDYRMPPDHPFPAAPEDCVAVYRALLETYDAARIVIGGGSAGGNIAAAATLMIRDRGLPLPAGIVLLTPEVDLTESGDTFRTNADLDVVLKSGLPEANALYAAGHDLRDPYLSPLFADFNRGFPPTFVQSGTRDLFLSNSVMIHRRLREAAIDAELHVWEAMPHGGFLMGEAPENAEIQVEVARFITRVTA